jgi:adenylate kinase
LQGRQQGYQERGRPVHASKAALRYLAMGAGFCVPRSIAHGLPGLLQQLRSMRFVLLAAPPEAIARRLTGATHRRRAISVGNTARVIQTQAHLVAQARAFGVPVMANSDVAETAAAILAGELW